MTTRLFPLLLCLLCAITSQAQGRIDQLVGQQLYQLKIKPSPRCDDATFNRRTTLLLTGKMAKWQQANNFLRSKDPKKREALIDSLLATEAFVDYQVLKWGDLLRIKSEFPSNIWPNGVQVYNRWLREQIRANRPYDQFVYDLLTSSGSNFRSPAVNFYRAFQDRTPENLAQNITLLFLGQRATPACFAQFFTQVKYKKSDEWKEEFVYTDLDIYPTTQQVEMPDGHIVSLQGGDDMRRAFATWLCSAENKQFARAIANRTWFWIMGRGIVHEPDDMSANNPASNPALLDYLSDRLIALKFDTRALMREILLSSTYGRSSMTDHPSDLGTKHFAYYPTTRITAEQFIDAVGDLTGIPDRYTSKVPEPYSYFPADIRAVQLGDGSVSSPQIELFGRPSRDVSFENDRNNDISSKQVLYLLNSTALLKKIADSPVIKQHATQCEKRHQIIQRLYLAMLARRATPEEMKAIFEHTKHIKNKELFADELTWALLNSTEFIFNH